MVRTGGAVQTWAADGAEDQWGAARAKVEMDLQMDVYASGSSNAARIAGRARLLA